MSKRIITGLFIAMLVFTAISITATIINSKKIKESKTIDPDKVTLVQLETLNGNIADDAEVAIITTGLGDIRAELYTQYAPKTVANFKALAEKGYYDGTYIYEIQNGIYLAGGSPYNDGTLYDGYDKKSESIEQEISKDLWPFKGSLMSCGLTKTSFWAGSRIIYGGSRFMAAGSIEFTDDIKNELLDGKENTKIEEAFIQYGGIPNASQQMTIFAQTYEGFDVLDELLSIKSDEETYRPSEEIEIQKVEICTYKESLEK